MKWKTVVIREVVYEKLHIKGKKDKRKLSNLLDVILSDYFDIPTNVEMEK